MPRKGLRGSTAARGGGNGGANVPSWLGETMPPRVCNEVEDGCSEEVAGSSTGASHAAYCHEMVSW
jgi:hypothetical protein